MKERVVIAMSGGVDSSVAAYLLKEKGYEVIGLFMRIGALEKGFEGSRNTKGCCSLIDSMDGRAVAEVLGISFYVLNFEREFDKIIDYFCAEYTHGRTPNPCIKCNQILKFGKLLDFAKALDAEFIATGHYAGIEEANGRYLLKQALDKGKDQSYVLAQLDQKQLSKAIFPLAGITKQEVRNIAKELNLKTKDKAESQEICFVQDNNYKNFVMEQIGAAIKPGIIRDMKGNAIGEHPGIQFFTIGQRRGLRIALGEPMYVVDINPDNNEITIGRYADLFIHELFATELNWIAIESLEQPLKISAKIRYNHNPVQGVVYPLGEKVRVEFSMPQPAITPGQAVVFYDEDRVVGSGWITKGVEELRS